MSAAPGLRRAERETVSDRLAEMIALLDVVDQAELFSDVPEQSGARARHEMGATLLILLRRQLRELRSAVADPPVDLSPDLWSSAGRPG